MYHPGGNIIYQLILKCRELTHQQNPRQIREESEAVMIKRLAVVVSGLLLAGCAGSVVKVMPEYRVSRCRKYRSVRDVSPGEEHCR